MNTKKIITGIGVIAILAIATFVMPNLLSNNNNKNSKKQFFFDREESESYNDAAKYIWSMRVNPNTGRIDIGEVEAARQQVNAMSMASQTARSKSGSADFQWQELGPDNIGGRTRAILISRTHPDSMFAGSVSGGLWRATHHGRSEERR